MPGCKQDRACLMSEYEIDLKLTLVLPSNTVGIGICHVSEYGLISLITSYAVNNVLQVNLVLGKVPL